MRFIYTTDLHGDIKKYNDVLKFAKDEDVKLIHLGADLLPKGSGILKAQKNFIKGFLKNFYIEAKADGIDVLAFFGNDDLYSRKKYFREYGSLLDEIPYKKDGFEFTAYGYVPDYPYGLKTACKRDSQDWAMQGFYISRPVDVGPSGFFPIEDIDQYFKEKGTIEEDLEKFKADSKTIVAIHCPPAISGLDVCSDGKRVGSKAVLNWIHDKQPLIVLCGHIHESYNISGQWCCNVGNAFVYQPGQLPDKTTMVFIEIDNSVESKLIHI